MGGGMGGDWQDKMERADGWSAEPRLRALLQVFRDEFVAEAQAGRIAAIAVCREMGWTVPAAERRQRTEEG